MMFSSNLLWLLPFILPYYSCAQIYQEQKPITPDWQQRVLSLGLEGHNVTGEGCPLVCRWLEDTLPVAQRSQSPQPATFKAESYYWSNRQAEVSPNCFVQPRTAEDVAAVVILAEKTSCQFAVKSGGHGAFVGASSIEEGLTIDLSLLNELSLSEDKTTTRVGPGNRWIDIYEYLLPYGVSVLGGRVAQVGVGGLTLGGGISFFSPKYGWALDGVRNYELVTGLGEILHVNQSSYADLYWALRGGGNNFGIVTSFDLETFPQGEMWGGVTFSDADYTSDVIDAFVQFAFVSPRDPDAHAYIFLDFTDDRDRLQAGSVLAYGRPIGDPNVLQNFTKIPTIKSSLRMTDVADLARELNDLNPSELRWSYSTATFLVSKEMVEACVEIFIEEAHALMELEGVVPVLVLQLITPDVISRFSRNGGNCLGIEDGEGPLLLLNFPVKWENAVDDTTVLNAAERIRDRLVERAKHLGLYHRYLYQNYADVTQDVFESYGESNLNRLREVSKQYDPQQVFQRLQPGYFKL